MLHEKQDGPLRMTHDVIRPLKSRDLPKLVQLARAYWQFERIQGFSNKRYRRIASKILRDPSMGSVWIAMKGDRLIGYLVLVLLISLEYGGMVAEIDELYVDVSARGRGVGGALLKSAGKRLWQKGIAQMSLRVGKSNPSAVRFYQKLGFRKRTEYLVMDRKGTRGW